MKITNIVVSRWWLPAMIIVVCWTCWTPTNAQIGAPPVCSPIDAREGKCQQTTSTTTQAPLCGLYLAESVLHKGLFGIYTGIDRDENTIVSDPREVHIPVYDSNRNEWSPIHEELWDGDVHPDLFLQNHYQTHSFLPGIGTTVKCAKQLSNVVGSSVKATLDESAANVHRSRDPAAGSFSSRHDVHFQTIRDLQAGEELFTKCSEDDTDDATDETPNYPRAKRSLNWLQQNGICIDSIEIKPSTIPNIGFGAFAKRSYKKGDVITASPVIHFDRSQMEIVEQKFEASMKRILYTEHVNHHQLLLNYCYGHKDSTILLLPYGPGVNAINHADSKSANVVVDWTQHDLIDEEFWYMPASEVLDSKQTGLIVDYVAIRDIEVGDELFVDYGPEWQAAWDAHVANWQPGDADYVSATRYISDHPKEPFKTIQEQETDPYPESIQTACYFEETDKEYDEEYEGEQEPVYWNLENNACLRPCKILERERLSNRYYYTVEISNIPNYYMPIYCELSVKRLTVLRTPAKAIRLVDKPYTTDYALTTSFRHEIGVHSDLYPNGWLDTEPNPRGSFYVPEMQPNQIELVRWADTRLPVTDNAYVMRMKPIVREKLLEYCEKMGITEKFRELTYRGNALTADEDKSINMKGLNWFIQRPKSHWRSNMHWISPADAYAHEDYLRALSAAGFDEVLQHIGEAFGYEGLSCYHVTFIAVSHCTQGYLHYDITNTGDRVFNVIIPLILANETGPELDILGSEQVNGYSPAGRLRYEYDVASLIGDDAYHATSAVDYRRTKEMRMAATVYIADINTENIDAILADYTQNYPPPGQPEILLAMAGNHWSRTNPNIKLPEPFVGDFMTNKLQPNEIAPITWKRTERPVSGFAHRIGLPSQLRTSLLEYCDKMGITERFHRLLLHGEELYPHHRKTQGTVEVLGGLDWYIQRPPKTWNSNMHWISPANAATHDSYLNQLLSVGGFDSVLASIGEYFNLDGLVAYHLSFMAVSHCVRGFVHHDFSDTDGKTFNVIVPLIIVDSTGPELEVQDFNDQIGGYRYVYDEATIIGDHAEHATGRVDYRDEHKYRLAASIYIADVNPQNAAMILKDFTQAYPPQDEEGSELLLSWAGRHWMPKK